MTTRRTRTPSDLKFLLNERAALAGLVRSSARDCRPLDAEAAKLEQKAALLRGQVAAIRAQQAKWQAEIAAIDDVLQAHTPASIQKQQGPFRRRPGSTDGAGS